MPHESRKQKSPVSIECSRDVCLLRIALRECSGPDHGCRCCHASRLRVARMQRRRSTLRVMHSVWLKSRVRLIFDPGIHINRFDCKWTFISEPGTNDDCCNLSCHVVFSQTHYLLNRENKVFDPGIVRLYGLLLMMIWRVVKLSCVVLNVYCNYLMCSNHDQVVRWRIKIFDPGGCIHKTTIWLDCFCSM